MTAFDLPGYLARVRLDLDHVTPDAQGLARLQRAQITAIPFENIDPLLGTVPDLDPAAIARKCLSQGRGGYCFELNRLFLDALEALGFNAQARLARVRMGAERGGPRSHMLAICTIGGIDFISDAGFGGPAPLEPIPLPAPAGHAVLNGTYATRTDDHTRETVLSRRTGTDDFALYGFDDAFVGEPDIAAANYLCATWPGAPFPSHLMVNGYDRDTRIGLFDTSMTETTGGRTDTRTLGSADDLAEVLCGRLGLALDKDRIAAVWDKIARRA